MGSCDLSPTDEVIGAYIITRKIFYETMLCIIKASSTKMRE